MCACVCSLGLLTVSARLFVECPRVSDVIRRTPKTLRLTNSPCTLLEVLGLATVPVGAAPVTRTVIDRDHVMRMTGMTGQDVVPADHVTLMMTVIVARAHSRPLGHGTSRLISISDPPRMLAAPGIGLRRYGVVLQSRIHHRPVIVLVVWRPVRVCSCGICLYLCAAGYLIRSVSYVVAGVWSTVCCALMICDFM